MKRRFPVVVWMAVSSFFLCGWLFVGVGVGGERDAETAELQFGPNDWPWWRGPTRNGVAPTGETAPLEWSENENIVWKAEVPGKGHGSPTVIGDQVFLTSAEPEEQLQSVLCFDRQTGELQWKSTVHKGGFAKKENEKSSLASTSVACDGELVFASFFNRGAIYLTALDRSGALRWQTRITDFVVHQGYAASPALYKSLVLISADSAGNGMIAGLRREDGKFVWKQPRPKQPSYSSPIILEVAGRDQVFLSGCYLVSSFDPETGEKLWEIEGSTRECVTSTVTDGNLIFTSGGYPRNHLAAVAGDGSGETVWQNKMRVYVPSMIVHGDHIYAVMDEGVAACWNCSTGTQKWKERLGGTFSASLVLSGDALYATNEEGRTFVYRASPKGYEPLGENTLGTSAFATPVICGGRIYTRVAHDVDGRRQELLYCIGK